MRMSDQLQATVALNLVNETPLPTEGEVVWAPESDLT
jgi:hypothetical protein